MKYLSFALVATLAIAPLSWAQNIATVWVYVTVPSSSSPASAAFIPQAETTNLPNSDVQHTFSPTNSGATSPISASSLSHTSLPAHETTSSQTFPQVTAAPSTDSDYYEPGQSSLAGGEIDTVGGASGSDAAAFRLSKGGLAAILIVVILVVIFGIASIVLFIVAKRRQWTMRQTLKRASRRLTGRQGQPKTPQTATAANRRSRRTGIRMGNPQRPGVKAVYPPGDKRALMVDVKDPEKGPQPLDGKAPKNTRPRENTWIQKLWGDGWK